MMNPMMIAQFREMMKGVKATIRLEYQNNRMIIQFNADSPEKEQNLKVLLENLGNQLAQVMGTYMGIAGEIVEVGKQ